MDASALEKVSEAADTYRRATSGRAGHNSARSSMSTAHDPLRAVPPIDAGNRPLFGEISLSNYHDYNAPRVLPDLARANVSGSRLGSKVGTAAPISPRTREHSIATSPRLRKYTISPRQQPEIPEVLPAMHASSSAILASPRGRQSLPSLVDQLGPLAGNQAIPAPSLPPSTHRASFPNNSAAAVAAASLLHSPSKDRPSGRLPNPLHTSRSSTAPYITTYTTTESSPASTVSALSPREFRPVGPNNPLPKSPPSALGHPNPLTRSPPSAVNYVPVHPPHAPSASMTPQSEVQTPLSASTQHSVQTLSSGSSPRNDTAPDFGTPVGTPRNPPPPPTTGTASSSSSNTVIQGGYKCDYPGCKAAPFQTQYLLK